MVERFEFERNFAPAPMRAEEVKLISEQGLEVIADVVDNLAVFVQSGGNADQPAFPQLESQTPTETAERNALVGRLSEIFGVDVEQRLANSVALRPEAETKHVKVTSPIKHLLGMDNPDTEQTFLGTEKVAVLYTDDKNVTYVMHELSIPNKLKTADGTIRERVNRVIYFEALPLDLNQK